VVTFFNRAEGRHDGNGGLDHYIAEVLSQQDYYAGGMLMPDEVMGILKVVKDPTPENIKEYLKDKATLYVKDRLLDKLTKSETKEKNKRSLKKNN